MLIPVTLLELPLKQTPGTPPLDPNLIAGQSNDMLDTLILIQANTYIIKGHEGLQS